MNKRFIKNTFLHLNKIHIHRKWVRYYGKQMGLSFWQRWTHDLSKYSPIEFFESVRYYQGTSSPIVAAKKDKGYSIAWLHHRGRNPHHCEWWNDNSCGQVDMPYKYAVELVCDYLAAARAYMGKDFSYKKELEWWQNKKQHLTMSKHTKSFVNVVLTDLAHQEQCCSYPYIDEQKIFTFYTTTKNEVSE